ncbi:MAG: hypothetical protein WDO15_21730 [Bacteroidota bacterium]
MKGSLYTVATFFLFTICLPLFGQTTTPKPQSGDQIGRVTNEEITLDLANGTISPQSLPFDVPFLLTGTVPKEITQITLTIIEARYACVDGDCAGECKVCPKPVKKAKSVTEAAGDSLKVAASSLDKEEVVIHIQGAQMMIDYAPTDENKTYWTTILNSVKEQQTKLDGPKTPDDGKAAPPCQCSDCEPVDFTTCKELCPWKASFLSRSKSNDNDTVNKFAIQVPALKPNRQYKFYFEVQRSSADEKTALKTLLTPIMRRSIFDEHNGTGAVNLSNQSVLQTKLRDAIVTYYSESFLVPNINVTGQLVDQTQLGSFQNMLLTERGNGDILTSLVGRLDLIEANIAASRVLANAAWATVLGRQYTSMLGKVLGLPKRSTEQEDLLQKLIMLDPTLVSRERIEDGRCALDNEFEVLDEIEKITASTAVAAYVANSVASQKLFKAIGIALKTYPRK